MLADVGDDDRLAVGLTPQIVDDVRGVQVTVVGQGLDVADRGVALERVDLSEPRRPIAAARRAAATPTSVGAQIAGDRHVHADVLVQLGAIDVDVNLARAERVGLEVAGDAIVEPHAQREEQVGLLDRGVHPRLAVHPHHAHIQRVRRRHAADPQQRDGNRDLRALGERDDFALGARLHHAVAGEDQRPLGRS